MWITKRHWLLIAAAAAVAMVVLVLTLLPRTEPPRARQYLAFTACLLTDGNGLSGTQAQAMWHGMQDASLATRAKVQYRSVTGPETPANASSYLLDLVQRHCDVVLAVGSAETAAVNANAAKFPRMRFAVVDGSAHGIGNVTSIDGNSPTQIRGDVDTLVRSLVRL